jgi:hypothetical protein
MHDQAGQLQYQAGQGRKKAIGASTPATVGSVIAGFPVNSLDLVSRWCRILTL